MRDDLIVSKSIDIKATPAKVWEALTNPAIIKEYLFGTETITDWKVESEIIFQGEYNGQKYRDKGKVVENLPGKILSYRYWTAFSGLEDKPENYSLVTYTIAPKDDSITNFTWTQKGFANEEGHKHSESGMDAFLASIKQIIER
jgi:uncharacterized protein YndB with AHSA1/START domain